MWEPYPLDYPQSAEDILYITETMWNLDGEKFGPTPKAWINCPTCGASEHRIMVQYWRYHEKLGDSRVRYRCDVGLKCTRCAMLWLHGVAIPEDYWKQYATRVPYRVYWREAERIHNRKPNRWEQ